LDGRCAWQAWLGEKCASEMDSLKLGTNEKLEAGILENSNVYFSKIEWGLIGFVSLGAWSCGPGIYCCVLYIIMKGHSMQRRVIYWRIVPRQVLKQYNPRVWLKFSFFHKYECSFSLIISRLIVKFEYTFLVLRRWTFFCVCEGNP
jgi:hypothetical protein